MIRGLLVSLVLSLGFGVAFFLAGAELGVAGAVVLVSFCIALVVQLLFSLGGSDPEDPIEREISAS